MRNKRGSKQSPAITPGTVVSKGLSEIPEPTSLSKPKILPEAYFSCSTLRLKFLPETTSQFQPKIRFLPELTSLSWPTVRFLQSGPKSSPHQGNSYKGKHFIGAGLQFQRCSPFLSQREHGGTQADIGLEKELKAIHLDLPVAAGDRVPHWVELECLRPQSPSPTVTHFLQQGHTYQHCLSLWAKHVNT